MSRAKSTTAGTSIQALFEIRWSGTLAWAGAGFEAGSVMSRAPERAGKLALDGGVGLALGLGRERVPHGRVVQGPQRHRDQVAHVAGRVGQGREQLLLGAG